jgi:hypothetical protein
MYGIYRNDWMDRIGIRADTWDARIHNSKTGQKNVSKTICRKIVLSFFSKSVKNQRDGDVLLLRSQ